MGTYHPPRIPGHSPSAVEHASIPFAFKAHERPSTQDKARRPVAAIGHDHNDMLATYHPPGIAEEVDGTSSAIYSVPSDSFEGIRGETSSARPQQCVHDDPDIPWHPWFFRGWRTALLRQRDECTLVLSVEACGGPNTQDRAGRHIEVLGHLFKHMMATFYPSVPQHPLHSVPSDSEGRNEESTTTARPQDCAFWTSAILTHPASSVLQSRLLRVPALDRRRYHGCPTAVAYSRSCSNWQAYFYYHHAYSSYNKPLTLTCHHLGQRGNSDMIAGDYQKFYKCYFAAICGTVLMFQQLATSVQTSNRRWSVRPIIFPAISFLVEANGSAVCPPARTGASWVASRARGILSIAAKTFIIHIFNSIRAFCVVVTASMVCRRTWSGLSAAAENLIALGTWLQRLDGLRHWLFS